MYLNTLRLRVGRGIGSWSCGEIDGYDDHERFYLISKTIGVNNDNQNLSKESW